MLYKEFLKLHMNLSPVGLEAGQKQSGYFCTPMGAGLIGWAGVDGIHYCQIKKFGEMVFSVSPMNTPNDYVHPLAKNFADFLRLLLACGDAAALEQIHGWSEEQFNLYLQENNLELQAGQEDKQADQKNLLEQLASKCRLTPMDKPYHYIKELQAGFDYSAIPYRKDYYEWVPEPQKLPEWAVYFEGGFSHHTGRDHAGKEIRLEQRFLWGEEEWYIPAAYSCAKGLVIDFCVKIEPERERAFIDKWDLWHEERLRLSEEQLRQENPMCIEFDSKVQLNGTLLREKHGYGNSWLPASCLPEPTSEDDISCRQNDITAEGIVKHYELDESKAWVLWRSCYPWNSTRRSAVHTLQLSLKQRPVSVSGEHFKVSEAGAHIPFLHPLTGEQHILTVEEYEAQELQQTRFADPNREFPTRFHAMTYTVAPQLPYTAFQIRDCAEGDHPRRRTSAPFEADATVAASIAIIGGADGPTAAFLSGKGGQAQSVASALHFVPQKETEWRMIFLHKTKEDIVISLIP